MSADSHDGRPWAGVAPVGPMFRPKDAATYIGVSLASFYAGAIEGLWPKPIKISLRASGVPRAWLDAVIADRVRRASDDAE